MPIIALLALALCFPFLYFLKWLEDCYLPPKKLPRKYKNKK